jgi:hypothetical protein
VRCVVLGCVSTIFDDEGPATSCVYKVVGGGWLRRAVLQHAQRNSFSCALLHCWRAVRRQASAQAV